MMLFYFIEIEQNLLEYNAWEMSPFYSNCIRINWKKKHLSRQISIYIRPVVSNRVWNEWAWALSAPTICIFRYFIATKRDNPIFRRFGLSEYKWNYLYLFSKRLLTVTFDCVLYLPGKQLHRVDIRVRDRFVLLSKINQTDASM